MQASLLGEGAAWKS